MKFANKAVLFGLMLPVVCTADVFNDPNPVFGDAKFIDQSIPVGGFQITPLVKFQQGFDGNVIRAKTDEIDSWFTIFEPSVEVTGISEDGLLDFEFDWAFTHGAYHASGEDSYNDHNVSSRLDYFINQYHELKFQGRYIDNQEPRGTRFSIGTADELNNPDRYKQLFGAVKYTFHFESFESRIELDAGLLDHYYSAVSAEDIITAEIYDKNAPRDRKTTEIGGKFYYQIGAVTDLVIEASRIDVNYDFTRLPDEELSSVENTFNVGAEWDITDSGITRGFAKVGYNKKDFDLAEKDSFNNLQWEVKVEWEPRQNLDLLTFTTARQTQETNGEGYFEFVSGSDNDEKAHLINNTVYSVQWEHNWLERVRTKLIYATNKDIYKGNIGTVRTDKNTGINVALYYDMQEWLSFSLEYTYSDRESTREFLIYDRDLFALGVRMSIF